jgi:2-amino-4-hydroxy-6-hydroxymethyldihydropteridine diphosphokinase
VEYATWRERYRAIQADFGFPFDREEASADALERLLTPADRRDPLGRVAAVVRGRDAIVVGLAPNAGPPPVWRLAPGDRPPVVLAADGATADCLRAALVPTIVTTDLDGPVPSEVTANGRGSLVVVHAHGDNAAAIERWVPEFPGPLAGSWTGPPRPALLNVGGFTDGDRAAFLAEASGARKILLWGFDFERVDEPDAALAVRKRAKLAWAERLLAERAATGRCPVRVWRRDGSEVPYPTGKYSTSTR